MYFPKVIIPLLCKTSYLMQHDPRVTVVTETSYTSN